MRRLAIAVTALALVAAACSGGSPAPDAGTSSTPAPGSSTAAASSAPSSTGTSSPLVIVAVDFAAGFVLLRNDGDEPVDLAGYWLCNRPNYVELPSRTVAPGEVLELDTAVSDLSLDPAGGELALYSSRSFGDPAAILRYVQWGSDGHGRTDVAVTAGVWKAGEFVDNQGGDLQSSGSDPISAADWTSS